MVTHQSTRLFGSPYYIAPELFLRATATTASDWYSVGVMLYEALTGRAPWSSTWLDLLHEKTTAEPAPPRSLASHTPPHLDALCLALLSRDPAGRRGTEVLHRLTEGLSSVSPEEQVEPRAVAAPFVGRANRLAVLRDAFALCASGRTSVVEVAGQSGIGKTALVHRFLKALREEHGDTDPVVVFGHLTPGEDGKVLVREGESWMAQQGVRQPYRMIATFVPGVWENP